MKIHLKTTKNPFISIFESALKAYTINHVRRIKKASTDTNSSARPHYETNAAFHLEEKPSGKTGVFIAVFSEKSIHETIRRNLANLYIYSRDRIVLCAMRKTDIRKAVKPLSCGFQLIKGPSNLLTYTSCVCEALFVLEAFCLLAHVN